MARHSLPLYPGRPHKPRNHRLGLWDGTNLDILDGAGGGWRTYHPHTYAEFRGYCLDNRADVRIESILAFQWLCDAVNDTGAVITASQSRADLQPTVTGITWREGNKWASLFSAQSWGDGATIESVQTHRETCDHLLPASVYSSPSALGQATIREKLSKWYTTLPDPCNQDLLDNLNGGRAELSSPGYYAVAYEVDRRMAYVAEATNPLPVGAPACIGDIGLETLERYPCWFGRCVVIVPHQLSVGPFPYRTSSGRLTFPVDAGHYVTWLWGQEAKDTLNSGCFIFPEIAWAWERLEPALAEWANWIFQKRMDAPSQEVADYIKKVAVAALGWFAMRGSRLRVQLATDNESELVIHNAQGYPTKYVAVPDTKARPQPLMPHWASYINMMARRAIYAETLAEQGRGNRVLSSDFDSLVLANHYRGRVADDQLGEWRERELTDVSLDVPRHLISREKVKRPGVAR